VTDVGFPATEYSFTDIETVAVKASAGRIFAIAAKTAGITIKNGTTAVWYVPANTSLIFDCPLELSASINLTSDATAKAYVQYE